MATRLNRRFAWLLLGIALVTAPTAFLYTGGYNVAADEPHWAATARVLTAVRERSIRTRAQTAVVPDLADAEKIQMGARHYGVMCAGCHLAPGEDNSELRAGLYPIPPNLAAASHGNAHGHEMRSPAEQFWIIKHGLKMTGMPAWGRTHDDEALWAIVAFVRQLPDLDVNQYRALTGVADDSSSHAMDHREQRHDDAAQAHGVLPTIEREELNAVAPAGQRAATDATTVSGQVHNH